MIMAMMLGASGLGAAIMLWLLANRQNRAGAKS